MKAEGGVLAAARRARPWLLRAIGLALLAYLVARVGLRDLLRLWASVDRAPLILAGCLAFGMMALKVERWRRLLRLQAIGLRFREAWAAYMAAYTVGTVTPGRAGEFIKVAYVRRRAEASLGTGMASVLLDRLLDVAVLLALAALGLAWIPQFAGLGGLGAWIVGAALASAAGLAALQAGRRRGVWQRVRQTLERRIGLDRLGGELRDVRHGLDHLLTLPAMLPAAALTLASWVCLVLACQLIALSLSLVIPFWFLACATAIAGLLSLLPVSIAGIGVRDTALVGVFGLLGISAQASLAYSLLYFAVFNVLLGACGAYHWYRDPVER